MSFKSESKHCTCNLFNNLVNYFVERSSSHYRIQKLNLKLMMLFALLKGCASHVGQFGISGFTEGRGNIGNEYK